MPLNVFQRTIVDAAGNIVPSAAVEVRDQITNNLVQVYEDIGGSTALGNPFTANAEGFVRFYADNGRYKITASFDAEERVWENERLGTTGAEIKYDRTAAENAASITPTNYQFIELDLERYGYGPASSASVNRTALLAALSVAAGTDFGYDRPAYSLLFPKGDATVSSGGDIVVPVNVSFISAFGWSKVTLSGTDKLIFRNPYSQGGAQGSASDYWPYANTILERIYFSGGGGIIINNYPGLRAQFCIFSNCPIEFRNSHGQWTEQTTFYRCSFGATSGSCLLFNGTRAQTNPGTSDGSFAYTTFDACLVANGGAANLIRVIDGGTLYGSKLSFKGNHVSSGALFKTEDTLTGSSINECEFDVRVESGSGTSKLFDLDGGNFWNNKGHISLPSYDFACAESGTSFRQNHVVITGATCKHPNDASITLTEGDVIATIADFSVVQRTPAALRILDLYRAGTMTAAANADPVPQAEVVGPLPINADRILRIELRARVAPSANADSVWYFDIRKGFFGGESAYGGLTSITLDDALTDKAINFAGLKLQASPFDGTWTQPVLASKPTDIAPTGKNDGTGPTDLYARIYYL